MLPPNTMTGMPWANTFSMAGMMASATVGYTISASTPLTSRSSMSASCFSGFSSALVMKYSVISGCLAHSALKLATRNWRQESPIPALLKPMTMPFLAPWLSPPPAKAASPTAAIRTASRVMRMIFLIVLLLCSKTIYEGPLTTGLAA